MAIQREWLAGLVGRDVSIEAQIAVRVGRESKPLVALEDVLVDGQAATFDHVWLELSARAFHRLVRLGPTHGRLVRLTARVSPYRRADASLDLGLSLARNLEALHDGEWRRVARVAHPRDAGARRVARERLEAEVLERLTAARQSELLALAPDARHPVVRDVLRRAQRGDLATQPQLAVLERLVGTLAQAAD